MRLRHLHARSSRTKSFTLVSLSMQGVRVGAPLAGRPSSLTPRGRGANTLAHGATISCVHGKLTASVALQPAWTKLAVTAALNGPVVVGGSGTRGLGDHQHADPVRDDARPWCGEVFATSGWGLPSLRRPALTRAVARRAEPVVVAAEPAVQKRAGNGGVRGGAGAKRVCGAGGQAACRPENATGTPENHHPP